MLAPVFQDDEDDDAAHHLVLGADQELMTVRWNHPRFGGAIVVIKINTILLLLSLAVATFCQYSTLNNELSYLNGLIWGQQQQQHENYRGNMIMEGSSNCYNDDEFLQALVEGDNAEREETPFSILPREENDHDTMTMFPNLLLLRRCLQSLAAILLLSFLRVVIFSNILAQQQQQQQQQQQEQQGTLSEAVLGDALFHIQCRIVIGFLACFMLPIPFHLVETLVVCLSIALQIASSNIL